MTKIISVIQLKGGAGKSTVATNLAGMLNEKGIPTKQGKQWQPMQISRLVKVAA